MDNLKRKSFLGNEVKRLLLKSIKKSTVIPYSRRYQAAYQLTLLSRISSRSTPSNRCVVSGRVWSVNRKTKYSRFIFRKEAYSSNIPGCRKASW